MRLFEESPKAFLSGEELSSRLGVSRTAIWKHIKALREEGYVFESQPRLGYRLVHMADSLQGHTIHNGLQTRTMGQKIIFREILDSTNALAKEEALNGAPEGLLVLAETQTNGRGRRGRSWISQSGKGIWSSLVLRPEVSPMEASKLTIIASVAVIKTIEKVYNLVAGIKWPNDIVLEGKKIAGILTELSADVERINHVILGIGINVSQEEADFPKELQPFASSLYLSTGAFMPRQRILQVLLQEFEVLYEGFLRGEFASILNEWRRYSVTIGKEVVVDRIKDQVTGIAIDVDADGVLLVQREDGTLERIVAGDVSLRRREGHYS